MLCIADVTGHGAASAMIGSESRAYLRAAARSAGDLTDLLRTMDSFLDFDLKGGNFLTLALVSLDLHQDRMGLLSAGHGPILKICLGGQIERIDAQLPPLGVATIPSEDLALKISLAPGEFLVLFSDGIMDRTNPEGLDFGQERIERALAQAFPEKSRDVVDLLFRETDLFAEGTMPPDDASVMVIGRLLPGR